MMAVLKKKKKIQVVIFFISHYFGLFVGIFQLHLLGQNNKQNLCSCGNTRILVVVTLKVLLWEMEFLVTLMQYRLLQFDTGASVGLFSVSTPDLKLTFLIERRLSCVMRHN